MFNKDFIFFKRKRFNEEKIKVLSRDIGLVNKR